MTGKGLLWVRLPLPLPPPLLLLPMLLMLLLLLVPLLQPTASVML
jgi:hypothetical protein